MRGLHLKQVQGISHYQRRRPVRFADVERRELAIPRIAGNEPLPP